MAAKRCAKNTFGLYFNDLDWKNMTDFPWIYHWRGTLKTCVTMYSALNNNDS